MTVDDQINEIIEFLNEVKEDSTVPKNVKLRIDNTIGSLRQKTEVNIKVSRALHELEEICDDANMQVYTRTQIWNIVSLLEKIA